MMQIGTVVDLDCTLVMEAARYPLPLADRIIYSTAARARALLWTQDEHFKDFQNVRFLGKSTPHSDP